MPIPILTEMPVIDSNSFIVIMYIPAPELIYFTSPEFGNCFFSNDETAVCNKIMRSNLTSFLSHFNLPVNCHFAAMAVRLSNSGPQVETIYENICLILNQEAIRNQTFIFNGDVKTLSFHYAKSVNKNSKKYLAIPLSRPAEEVLSILQKCVQNECDMSIPRKVPRCSGYFEARLFRPLLASDIEAIVIPNYLAPEELALIQHISTSS